MCSTMDISSANDILGLTDEELAYNIGFTFGHGKRPPTGSPYGSVHDQQHHPYNNYDNNSFALAGLDGFDDQRKLSLKPPPPSSIPPSLHLKPPPSSTLKPPPTYMNQVPVLSLKPPPQSSLKPPPSSSLKPPPSPSSLKSPPPESAPRNKAPVIPVDQAHKQAMVELALEQKEALVSLAQDRFLKGQCPSCGVQLFRVITERSPLSALPRLKSALAAPAASTHTATSAAPITDDSMGHIPEQWHDETEVLIPGEGDPSSGPAQSASAAPRIRRIPLTVEGHVLRGQCLACSTPPGPGSTSSSPSKTSTHFLQAANSTSSRFLRQSYDENNESLDRETEALLASLQGDPKPRPGPNASASIQTPPAVKQAMAVAGVSGGGAAVYQGEHNAQGERHGKGEMVWTNGDVYKGEFRHGQRHGHGTLEFADGSEYVGSWENNQMHGMGTRRFANGDCYLGSYVHGQRTGEGRFYFANGDMYHGEFSQGQLSGLGRYYYSSGQRFEGTFFQGRRHGKGKLQKTDGSLDVFVYRQDQRIGTGVRWSADRTKAWLLTPPKRNKITSSVASFWCGRGGGTGAVEESMASPLQQQQAAGGLMWDENKRPIASTELMEATKISVGEAVSHGLAMDRIVQNECAPPAANGDPQKAK